MARRDTRSNCVEAGAGLRRAVDLDDVAVGIEEEELGETGQAIAADHDTHRVILRRVFRGANCLRRTDAYA
jgi:hypothetical protein